MLNIKESSYNAHAKRHKENRQKIKHRKDL